jgi:hypothetical protein
MTDRGGLDRRRASLFWITTLALGGLLTHGTYAGSGDEPHYLAIAHSLAFDRDLDLSNNYGAAEPLIGGGALTPGLHVRPGAGGILRPVHDVGLPLLFAPYVRVMAPAIAALAPRIPAPVMRRLRLTPSTLYRNVIAIAMILIAGLLATQMYAAFITTGAPPRTAFWTALLVALSPPLLVYGILFFTELLSALLCLIAFQRLALDQGPPRTSGWALAGLAAGLMVLVHVRNAGLVAGLLIVAADRLRREALPRVALAFAGPLAALVIASVALRHRMWGAWLTTPRERMGEWHGVMATLATAGTRLAGMLADQEFGLLPYAPVFLLCAAGTVALGKTRPAVVVRLWLVAGGYLLAVMLPMVNVHGWTGGWSPAARFVVPIVPLLALALAAGLRSAPRAVVVPILILQIAIDAYVWQHPKILWNDGDGVAAVCDRLGTTLCRYLPSLAGSD